MDLQQQGTLPSRAPCKRKKQWVSVYAHRMNKETAKEAPHLHIEVGGPVVNLFDTT